MKTFYKITGIIFIIGCFFFLKSNYTEIETYHNGHIISATIIYVPNCVTTKVPCNIKFSYNEKEYVKRIGVLSSKELNEGDIIKLKTNKENSAFLYENENPINELTSTILLSLFGIFLIYMGFKK